MSYKADPNDSKKQIPSTRVDGVFSYADGNVSSSVVMDFASSVILQGVGKYNFKYDCTTAVGSALVGGDFSGSKLVQVVDTDNDVLTLPISPCAVSASAATNVTFIYKGGL